MFPLGPWEEAGLAPSARERLAAGLALSIADAWARFGLFLACIRHAARALDSARPVTPERAVHEAHALVTLALALDYRPGQIVDYLGAAMDGAPPPPPYCPATHAGPWFGCRPEQRPSRAAGPFVPPMEPPA